MKTKIVGNPNGRHGKLYKFSEASRAQMSESMKKRWRKRRGLEIADTDKQANDEFIAWMLSQGSPNE